MKNLYISIVCLLSVCSVYSQNQYIRSWEVSRPGIKSIDEVVQLAPVNGQQSTQYVDGFGRTIQIVAKAATPGKKDVVQPYTFDPLGRPARQMLPYAANANTGSFQASSLTDQESFYNGLFAGDGHFYQETMYDETSLNRVVGQRKPGNAWEVNGKEETYAYGFVGNKQIWTIGTGENALPATAAVYAAGTLLTTQTTTEQGDRRITYADFKGNTILEQVKNVPDGMLQGEHGGTLSTYYVYDDFNRLRYIITPKAVEWLDANNWQMTQTIADELCYKYAYDDRGRRVMEKQPGAGEQEVVYDNRGRVVYARNATDRINHRWKVSLYDQLDRVRQTGYIKTDLELSRIQLQQQVEQQAIDNPVPVDAVLVILNTQYYDDYSFPTTQPFSNNYQFPATTNPNILSVTVGRRTLDKPTGNLSRIINDENDQAPARFLASTYYYDERDNLLQIIGDNYLNGIDIVTSQHDYAGLVTATCQVQNIPGTSIQNFHTGTAYEYDDHGRVLFVSKSYGEQPYHKLIKYAYDELGRTKTQMLAPDYNNGQGIETLNYEYNLQGWLRGVNTSFVTTTNKSSQWDHYFGEVLAYENSSNVFSRARYDGALTGTIWKSQGDNVPRKYEYDYSRAGFLTKADFAQNESLAPAGWNSIHLDASAPEITYDVNGNISAIRQKGLLPGHTSPSLVDDLTYQYENDGYSNKLKAINDAVTSNLNGIAGDFKNAANTPIQQYVYDQAGNVIKDGNKGMQSGEAPGIAYNVLNKPWKIIIQGKYELHYIYDAAGSLLAKRILKTDVTPNVEKWQYYSNGLVLYDQSPQYFINESGRLRISQVVSTAPNTMPSLQIGGNNGLVIDGRPAFFDYFITDHQGNTRAILTEEEHVEDHLATLETTDAGRQDYEERMFGKVNESGSPDGGNEVIASRDNIPQTWNSHYNDAGNQKASRLHQTQPIGPNALLKVMAGDLVNLRTDYFFTETPTSGDNGQGDIANAVLNAFLSSLPAVQAGAKEVGTQLQSQFNNGGGVLASYLNNPDNGSSNPSIPKAYLNWIFFDENFNVLPYDPATSLGSGAKRVVSAGDGNALTEAGLKVPANGYLYVYVSNTSNTNVWFDNLSIRHIRSRLMQEHHYYPYGLEIASISSKAYGKLDNYFRYQGAYSEWEEETGWNDFELRNYDAQIGRFMQQDPYSQFYSPYTGMGNDPVNTIDPSGGWGIDFGTIGKVTGSVLGDRLLVAGAGAAVGYGIDKLMGGNGAWGAAIGAGVGFGATFIPPIDIGSIASPIVDAAPAVAMQGANFGYNIFFAGYTTTVRPDIVTLWNAYNPDGQGVIRAIGGGLTQFAGQNTCAIRLSNAFNNIGYSIPSPRKLPANIRAVSTSYGNFIFGSPDMGRYLTNIFGPPDVEYEVTSSNYTNIYNALSTQQGLIHMTPSDPVGWAAAGHVDVFGTYQGKFDLRSSFENGGSYAPHMLGYLQSIAQQTPTQPVGKVRVWRLQGTLPKPAPKPQPVKRGFWNWLKNLFS